jgi:hypothetical protein
MVTDLIDRTQPRAFVRLPSPGVHFPRCAQNPDIA